MTEINKSNGVARKRFSSLRFIPFDIGLIHMVGIGGIGMSGIAEILHNMGYKVQGSDISENYNVKRLQALGIKTFIGHKVENVEGASVIVKSTAVQSENPEIVAALNHKIPVVRRSEMLAELTRLKATIAIAGSHGKTTTTSMIAHLLQEVGLEPTVINGGIINSIGSNARLGSGDWLIAEADESDGTFIKIPATVGVVTNIDPEHMDYWKTIDRLEDAFKTFLSRLPFYGFAVVNKDHDLTRKIAEGIENRRIYYYSMEDKNSDIYGYNIKFGEGCSIFKIKISEDLLESGKSEEYEVTLPCFGKHNISNSLAALAVGLSINIPIQNLIKAFANFGGVKRRFTITGVVNGVTVVDDYAHHPAEIKATLSAGKHFLGNKKGRVIAVMQPHRYTRMHDLFSEFAECFADADYTIITEMYSAGESPIEGINQHSLAQAVKKNGKEVISMESDSMLAQTLKNIIKEGDLVICMGAGTITYMAAKLPQALEN